MKTYFTQFPIFFRTVSLFIIIALTTGCWEKENKTYIVEADQTLLNFTERATQLSFNITSNGGWHIEAAYLVTDSGKTSGTADWFIIDKMYGNGNATVTIQTLDNQIPDFGNSTILYIKGNYNQVTIKLKQNAPATEE